MRRFLFATVVAALIAGAAGLFVWSPRGGNERRDDRREKETPHEILAAESAEALFSLIFAARAS